LKKKPQSPFINLKSRFSSWKFISVLLVSIFSVPMISCFVFSAKFSELALQTYWPKFNDLSAQCSDGHCIYLPQDVGTIYLSSIVLSIVIMMFIVVTVIIKRTLGDLQAKILPPLIASVLLAITSYSVLLGPLGRDQNAIFAIGNYVDVSYPYIAIQSIIGFSCCLFVWLVSGLGVSNDVFRPDQPFSSDLY